MPKPPKAATARASLAALIGLALGFLWADRLARVEGWVWLNWFRDLPAWLAWLIADGLWLFYGGFALVLAVGLARRRPRLVRAALTYLAAETGVALVAVQTLKSLIGRPRPLAAGQGWLPLTLEADFHSLPSGHSADAFVGLAVVLWFSQNRWLRAAAWVLAVVVALGRVAQFQHHPTDVVAGAWVGFVGAAWLCWLIDRSAERAAGTENS